MLNDPPIGLIDFLDDLDSERSDAFESMRRELASDRRVMQQQWQREQQVHRRDLHQRLDDLERRMQAIQDARDESDDGFVDLSAVFESIWTDEIERVPADRPRARVISSGSVRQRPQYTYDPEIRKVRLAYERVNWQKEGF